MTGINKFCNRMFQTRTFETCLEYANLDNLHKTWITMWNVEKTQKENIKIL